MKNPFRDKKKIKEQDVVSKHDKNKPANATQEREDQKPSLGDELLEHNRVIALAKQLNCSNQEVLHHGLDVLETIVLCQKQGRVFIGRDRTGEKRDVVIQVPAVEQKTAA